MKSNQSETKDATKRRLNGGELGIVYQTQWTSYAVRGWKEHDHNLFSLKSAKLRLAEIQKREPHINFRAVKIVTTLIAPNT